MMCLQREHSPATAEIKNLLAGAEQTEDNDIVLDEYFSDDEEKKEESLQQ